MKRLFLTALLITMSLNLFAQMRPEIRKANERLKELTSLADTHCDSMGSFATDCKNDFKSQMRKKIKTINSAMIHDYDNKAINKIHADISEEKLVRVHRKFLTMHGVMFSSSEKSDSLELKVSTKKLELKEMEVCLDLKAALDLVGVEYFPEDDSIELRSKLDTYNASQEL